jgi:hypothetical protein
MRASAILAVATVMLVSHAAIADVKRHKSIPESIWGSWAPSPDDCKSPDKSVVLSAKTYISPEANCTVAWVSKTAGARGSLYSAHLLCSKPKDIQSDVIFLRQSTDRISIGSHFGDLKSYQRC